MPSLPAPRPHLLLFQEDPEVMAYKGRVCETLLAVEAKAQELLQGFQRWAGGGWLGVGGGGEGVGLGRGLGCAVSVCSCIWCPRSLPMLVLWMGTPGAFVSPPLPTATHRFTHLWEDDVTVS
jgi:hypothetical protein